MFGIGCPNQNHQVQSSGVQEHIDRLADAPMLCIQVWIDVSMYRSNIVVVTKYRVYLSRTWFTNLGRGPIPVTILHQ